MFDGGEGTDGGKDGKHKHKSTKRGRANAAGDAHSTGEAAAPQQPQQATSKGSASTAAAATAPAISNAKAKAKASSVIPPAEALRQTGQAADGAVNKQRKQERMLLINAKFSLRAAQTLKAIQAAIMVTFVIPTTSCIIAYIDKSLKEYAAKIFNNKGHAFGSADAWVWKAATMCMVDKFSVAAVVTDEQKAQLAAIADNVRAASPASLGKIVSHAYLHKIKPHNREIRKLEIILSPVLDVQLALLTQFIVSLGGRQCDGKEPATEMERELSRLINDLQGGRPRGRAIVADEESESDMA